MSRRFNVLKWRRMTGLRLLIGIVTTGIIVPAVIFFFLRLNTIGSYFAIAIPSFFGWCIAEFVANILARPRLENRTPGAALKEWDRSRTDLPNE